VPGAQGTESDEAFFKSERTARFEMVRNDIAKRLRKACGHITDADFALLVEKMARVQLRAETRNTQQS
jgi:hypothetical protein